MKSLYTDFINNKNPSKSNNCQQLPLLSRELGLKKHIFFVGAFTAFLLSGNIVGIASGSTVWPYKPHRTGCEGPVQSMSARSVHYIKCSVGPDHFALVSLL